MTEVHPEREKNCNRHSALRPADAFLWSAMIKTCDTEALSLNLNHNRLYDDGHDVIVSGRMETNQVKKKSK